MEQRKKELLDLVSQDQVAQVEQLVDEIIFIESQLVEMKKLPFIAVDPRNSMRQKATPAAKLYKELMQQYNNSLRLLLRLSGDLGGEVEQESPLRQWVKARKEMLRNAD